MQEGMPDSNALEWRAASVPAMRVCMESRAHCAYNRTRECFLGLGIEAADLVYPALAERLQSLALKSGEGMWIVPFRGIPSSGLSAPVDLVYLDAECRVMEMVESFPTFQISPSAPRPASVLALPAHSIYQSQTQVGDQLILCMAEEMEARLEGLTGTKSSTSPSAPIRIEGAVLLREKPLWSGGPGTVELEAPDADLAGAQAGAKAERHQMDLIQTDQIQTGRAKPELAKAGAKPGGKAGRDSRNWLERWWSPDPRRAPREPAHGLAAYYWNGSAPEAHGIKDISSTGMYVVTEERWYPGTLVLMTLQRTESGEHTAERSISVLSRAVRWGQDGVGLQFVLADSKGANKGKQPMMETADRRDFERFLQLLKRDNEGSARASSSGILGLDGAGEVEP